MKKLLFFLIISLLVGCNNNELKKGKELELVDDASSNCTELTKLTYDEYQKNINVNILEAICVNHKTTNLYELAFKINNELVYWYSYGNGINAAGNTENYEENKQKCLLETATDIEKMECSNQKLLIDNYNMYRGLVGNDSLDYKVILIDMSTLK